MVEVVSSSPKFSAVGKPKDTKSKVQVPGPGAYDVLKGQQRKGIISNLNKKIWSLVHLNIRANAWVELIFTKNWESFVSR